jgi:hypothetical protein
MSSRISTLSELDAISSEASNTALPNAFGRLIQSTQGPQIEPSHKQQTQTRDACRRLSPSYNDEHNPWQAPPLNQDEKATLISRISRLNPPMVPYRNCFLYSRRSCFILRYSKDRRLVVFSAIILASKVL